MAEHPFEKLRVLLVEDESLVAMLMEDILRQMGFGRVIAAARIAAAKDALIHEGCDLAILDINIAGDPIFPFAMLLAGRGIPFFFVTGYAGGEVPKAFRDRQVLRKPFHYDALTAAIRAALDRRPGDR